MPKRTIGYDTPEHEIVVAFEAINNLEIELPL